MTWNNHIIVWNLMLKLYNLLILLSSWKKLYLSLKNSLKTQNVIISSCAVWPCFVLTEYKVNTFDAAIKKSTSKFLTKISKFLNKIEKFEIIRWKVEGYIDCIKVERYIHCIWYLFFSIDLSVYKYINW